MHKRDHYVDKLLLTLHFVFVSEKLYKVKHTNGQVIFRMSFTFIKSYLQINRLIDWREADNGFGEFIITYVNENSQIRCSAKIDMNQFEIKLVS